MDENLEFILSPPPNIPQAYQNQQVFNQKSSQADRALFTFHSILVTIKLDEKKYTIWRH